MDPKVKIGLLIGLVILFFVAFMLKGLPGIGDVEESDEQSVFVDSEPLGIIPEMPPEASLPTRVPEQSPKDNPPPKDQQQYQIQLLATTLPDEIDNSVKPVKQTWPKIHVVREGDNLSDIAKRYYGPKKGNRKANIKKIFEANHKSLESPDKIYPGQELIIPSL